MLDINLFRTDKGGDPVRSPRSLPYDARATADLDAARIQLMGLTAPIRESKGAQDLGAGDEAADALVDVMKQIGVLS